MAGQAAVTEAGGLWPAPGRGPVYPDHLTGGVEAERPDAETAHHACAGINDAGLGPDAQAGPPLQLPGQDSPGHPVVDGGAFAEVGPGCHLAVAGRRPSMFGGADVRVGQPAAAGALAPPDAGGNARLGRYRAPEPR